MTGALILLLALGIDRRWGEPPVVFHPVVWIGNYLKICGRVTVRCPPALAFALGALAWALGAGTVAALAWVLQHWALGLVADAVRVLQAALGDAGGAGWMTGAALTTLALAAFALALLGALLKTMLAWRMLRDEAGAVEAALTQSLDAGRERLSWLVSRDTAQLSASEVRESAIETLAENLNDSVVAPIFWFLLLGLPGAAVYRFANTADAMWGYRGTYKGQHWEWAGKWAAWADDWLSWLPARITGLTLLSWRLHWLTKLRREARKTPSPNGGWPMGAMALRLNLRLAKPGTYELNPTGSEPDSSAIARAYGLALSAMLKSAALLALGAFLLRLP
ncbi:MAG: adenosylcobinamide-phosphate synthase CbiB [Polaromonas sp.]|nr:adenosylcobinamide-phosphate synthase CbiB [Polaromonas sp.]